jgi:hypothetical protein
MLDDLPLRAPKSGVAKYRFQQGLAGLGRRDRRRICYQNGSWLRWLYGGLHYFLGLSAP